MVWRRLRVAGSTSLASLHYIIQMTQGWTDDHLHQFHIYGKDYGIGHAGGMSFSDNAYQVQLDDFQFSTGDRFTYEYNFFDYWLHDIRIEAIDETSSSKKTPFCLSGQGMQGATEYDVNEKMIALFKLTLDAPETMTVGDFREHLEALDGVRFNRQRVNRDLASLDLKNPAIASSLIIG